MLKPVVQRFFYEKLGDNIRVIRDQKNIKQETLANCLGLSRVSISNIETGKQRIQLHLLITLADYLQVSLTELLPEREIPRQDLSSKMEKKISNTEMANNLKSLEKIKDFIRLSTSNQSK